MLNKLTGKVSLYLGLAINVFTELKTANNHGDLRGSVTNDCFHENT